VLEPPTDRLRFLVLHLGVPLLLASALLALGEFTDLDLSIQALFFEPSTGHFPYRVSWFFESVIHNFGRLLVVLVASGFLIAFGVSFRSATLAPLRWNLLLCALTIALGPIVIAQMKHVAPFHCPNDLALFGGDQPYLRLLDPIPPGMEYGHCWPGGHSSGGFSIMACYFAFRRRAPRLARWLLVGGFAYGNVLGLGRVIQGSHFLSHQLWAALICWVVGLGLYELLLRRYEDRQLAGE
jgi:membrane-associated PAP2 superfamily phosphatase